MTEPNQGQRSPRVNVDELKSRISIDALISATGVELKRQGNEFKGLCPFHDEKTPSFTVTPEKGYFCFGCDAKGDHLDFLQDRYGLDFKQAVDKLQEFVGEGIVSGETTARKPATRKPKPADKWRHQPCPQDVPPPENLPAKRDGKWIEFPVIAAWPYRDRSGVLHGYCCRIEPEPDKKEIIPVCWMVNTDTGEAQLRQKSLQEPRLLYGTELLDQHPNANIILTEGEKATDAARRLTADLPVIVLSWPGGCKAVPKADWSLLAGRKIVGWPDTDSQSDRRTGLIKPYQKQPGMGAMLEISEQVSRHGGQMRIIAVPYPGHLSDGWDAADAEAEGWTGADVMAYIKSNIRTPEEIMAMPAVEPEPEPEHEYPEYDAPPPPENSEPFRILGWNDGTGYYLSSECRQIYCLTPPQHSKAYLMALAPIWYWRETFPLEKRNQGDGVDWTLAVESLIRRAQRTGIFDPDKVRGRGAWWDDDRVVVHLGDRLIIDGKTWGLTEAPTDYVYEESIPLRLAGESIMPNSDAHKLVDICNQVTWEEDISGMMLAGWIFLAPICGALDWRPHIWVTGGAGTGKSTVMKKIVGQTLRRNMLFVVGDTSEAGLRQELGQDAMPVVFDEFEGERKKSLEKIDDVLALVTQASSETGAKLLKGGANGKASSYKIRSMFAFSSIGVTLKQHAAQTRVTVLSLKKPGETNHTQEAYRKLIRDINDTLTDDYVDALQARAVAMIPQIRANAEVFAEAAAVTLKGRRFGDQVGTLLAGAYGLHAKGVISREKAEEWIKSRTWNDAEETQESTDEVGCITRIMTHEIRVETVTHGTRTRTVAEMIDSLSGGPADGELQRYEAEDALKRNGIRIEKDEDGSWWVGMANHHKAIARMLQGTQWESSWPRTVGRIDGARRHGPKKYAGVVFRGIEIPKSKALSDE